MIKVDEVGRGGGQKDVAVLGGEGDGCDDGHCEVEGINSWLVSKINCLPDVPVEKNDATKVRSD